MAIAVHNEHTDAPVFLLHTPHSTYVIYIENGYLCHGGWFDRTEHWSGHCVCRHTDIGFSPNPPGHGDRRVFSLDTVMQEYPFAGRSDFRAPAFKAFFADGSHSADLCYKSFAIIKGKPQLTGLPAVYTEDESEADTLTIALADPLTGLTVGLSYTVFCAQDIICRHTIIINPAGAEPVMLNHAMSACIDFPDSSYRVLTLSGAHCRERVPFIRPLAPGVQQVFSRRGVSSHQHHPFMALLAEGAAETQGVVYGFSLVYSGNFIMQAEVDQCFTTRVTAGINPETFCWKLEPGNSFITPELVMVRSTHGLGGMSRAYHDLYRSRLCRGEWRDKDRPVIINNWEATYFAFNTEKLLTLADAAKQAGIELFVLDDGWFGERDDDFRSLGDWSANAKKLPGGLSALAQAIQSRGMSFGLWVEPEMVSENSSLFCAHPDWCLHVSGRTPVTGRSQLVLDLSRDDVVDYLISVFSETFASTPISYVKWDCNRHLTDVASAALPPDRQGETPHRFILGLYRLMDTLTRRFPHVLFESCSGGGGRYDPGILYYMPQTWTSDNTDAPSRVWIQLATSIVYPASTMACHVSAVPNHQTGRTAPLMLRFAVAAAGMFGYELDLTKLPQDECAEIQSLTARYKELRTLVRSGDLYRIQTPWHISGAADYAGGLFGSGDSAAWMYVSKDKSEALVTLVWLMPGANPAGRPFRLQGLDPAACYRVMPVWAGDDTIYDNLTLGGAELMHAGLFVTYQISYRQCLVLKLVKA